MTRIITSLLISLFLTTGCAFYKQPLDFQPQEINHLIASGQYVQKPDNFLIMLDTSKSMGNLYKGQSKLGLAKDVISYVNQTLTGLELMGSLKVFGDRAYNYTFSDYALTKNFDDFLKSVQETSGESMSGKALEELGQELGGINGQTALILISDGLTADDTESAAKYLKQNFGSRLNIHTICVGQNKTGQKILADAAKAGGGFSENATRLLSGKNVADFVQKTFLVNASELTDEPKVFAKEIHIIPQIKKAGVIKTQKTKVSRDTDGDGILDDSDDCPQTPKGVSVNERGCWIIKNILFDPGQWRIRSKYYQVLDEVASAIMADSDLHVEIQGHTDNLGTEAKNMALSEKRANAVKTYFLEKGVSKQRLAALGYGFSTPVSSNKTKEGRALNRRVHLAPIQIQG